MHPSSRANRPKDLRTDSHDSDFCSSATTSVDFRAALDYRRCLADLRSPLS